MGDYKSSAVQFDSNGSAVPPWLDCTPLPHIKGLPDYGWRVGFDLQHHEPCVPFTMPRLHQMKGFIGLSFRYIREWYNCYRKSKKMFIDNLALIPWKPLYGAPIGGFGCGSIGRGYRGEFCRFQMIPGMYTYNVVQADQFMVCVRKRGTTVFQQVLSPNRPSDGSLRCWNWGFPDCLGTYHALYPRSWTVYDIPGQNIRLICRQISPVLPHNYKDSSLPAAVFVWSVENFGHEEAEVSIMFTFQSGQGEASHSGTGVETDSFSSPPPAGQKGSTKGVSIHQTFNEMPCVYALSAKETEKTKVSTCPTFDPAGSGHELWMDLLADGQLNNREKDVNSSFSNGKGSAVCVQTKVGVGKTEDLEFSLTWDMPLIHFGGGRKKYRRMYTRWFGAKGTASADLASYALHNYKNWEEDIEKWQNPILDNEKYPSWYKSALFNEVYYVSDGGTLWVDVDIEDEENVPQVIKEYGRFAYLEGHEYRMYNTYDVHHDASYCLIMLWPKLQLSLQYDVGIYVQEERTEQIKFLMDGKMDHRKALNCVPHDIGDPDDDVWLNINAYKIHGTQEWKDLNPKFILQVYRDYAATGDRTFLEDLYPATKAVMEYSLKWDTDNDGIIDNGGFADQTYDAWSMYGASAYCGGLWVAAVKAFCEVARLLGKEDDLKKFSTILEKGKSSFVEKLWNGEYYNFDSSRSDHFDTCMSGQLSGHLFLKSSGIPDDAVFPRDHVLKALRSIFNFNVMSFENGTMGAMNGVRPNGQGDRTSPQSEEFWVGITYSVGALMLFEGLDDIGWQTAYGPYHVCWERYGLHFQTPEAYFENRQYRSLGYMRPLAIWSVQYALEKRKKQT